jgi:hypothetical protein
MLFPTTWSPQRVHTETRTKKTALLARFLSQFFKLLSGSHKAASQGTAHA